MDNALENVIFKRYIERKRSKEKQQVTYLVSFCEWMVEQGQ